MVSIHCIRKIIGREIFELYIDGIDTKIRYFHPTKSHCCVYNISIMQDENRVYNFIARQKQHFSQGKTERREKASVKHNHKGYQ